MSSDEDEFYDAPNAFLASKWSDSNEDLYLTALEKETKNAERRNRVESLRRNHVYSYIQHESSFQRDDNSTLAVPNFQTQELQVRSENENYANTSLIQAMLYQQQIIQQLQNDPNLCQCMKHLLNSLSSQIVAEAKQNHQHSFPLIQTQNSSMTQSCPECCKPIYSLGTALGISNVFVNTKSWSLDSAKVLEIEKQKRLAMKILNKEQSHTLPAEISSPRMSHLEIAQTTLTSKDGTVGCGQETCIAVPKGTTNDKCQYCQHQTDQTGIMQPDIVLHSQAQFHHLPDQSFILSNDNTKTLQNLNSFSCVCNKNKSSTSETFTRNDSLKVYKTQKDSVTHLGCDQKATIGSKASNPLTDDIPPEMNPIEVQFRERTKSMEIMLKENRSTSLQRSEDSERNKDNSDFSQRAFLTIGGTVKKLHRNMKSAISAVSRAKIFNQDEQSSSEDEEFVGNRGIRLRSSRRMKGQRDFLQIKLVQEVKDEHTGAIWALRFSPCGRLLATAGYDRAIRVWVLRQYYWYFKQYQRTAGPASTNSNNDKIDSDFDLNKQPMMTEDEIGIDSVSLASTSISTGKTDGCGSTCSSGDDDIEQGRRTPFRSKPFIIYRGHEGVVTDLVWSKNLFLLATSMDRQVRLWHISRRECLCIFNHNDTVPTVVFHPKDDRYFLSGSLDGKLRLWNIPDKKIRYWVEALLPNSLPMASVFSPLKSSSNTFIPPKTVITCAAFVCDATKIVVGTYDGRVLFYTAELEYITSMAIKSSHGKSRHCRVTAIEVDPTDSCKILATSNDSRVRLIDARDYHIICKYRGFVNSSSQIRASFSPTGKYVISGSENSFFYIWKKDVEVNKMTRFSTTRKDRNNYWEAIKGHETVVSVAVFSPSPHLVLDKRFRRRHSINMVNYPYASEQQHLSLSGITKSDTYLGEVIVSADISGVIRVFKNRVHSHPISANKK